MPLVVDDHGQIRVALPVAGPVHADRGESVDSCIPVPPESAARQSRSTPVRVLTVVRRQGLPKISLHGLRHSFASVANSQGVPMFDISRTLGHSSMTVTSNIYTHLFDDTEAQALAAVARAIEKA